MLRTTLKMTILTALIVLTASVNWQASGFTNQTRLRMIYDRIDEARDAGHDADALACYISDELNSMWSTFWNVFIIKNDAPGSDAIGYKFSYNKQWLWHNNYGPEGRTYIVWKDNNCKTRFSWSTTSSRLMVGNSGLEINDVTREANMGISKKTKPNDVKKIRSAYLSELANY